MVKSCPGLQDKYNQVKYEEEGRNAKANHKEKLEVREDQLPIRKQDVLWEDLILRMISNFERRIPDLL